MKITESELEEHTLDILQDLGYKIINGYDISPDGKTPERKNYQEVVLVERLKKTIEKLNPEIPESAREEAIKKVLRVFVQNQIVDNQQFHKLLTEGVSVEFRKKERVVGDYVKLINFENPEKNEFLAVNQFTIIEDKYNRRPDILLFVNGLPLVLFELKNPAEEKATINDAFQQLQNYKTQIPSLFRFNEILIISDGMQTEAGTLSSNRDRFMPWKSINGKIQEKGLSLEILSKGMLNKETILDLIRNFIVFEKEKDLIKKLGAYHQYNAVNKALESTIKATKGNKKAGVVWHTQGSGKSLSMVFYASKLAVSKELENLTIVVLTDRNDLDGQLHDTFARKIKDEQKKGKDLGLNSDEKAFYDALADCKEAIDVLGNKQLRIIALELWDMIRKNVKTDWTMRENIQAELRLKVKRILKRYGYPPSGQEHAIELVLKQAHVVAGDLAESEK